MKLVPVLLAAPIGACLGLVAAIAGLVPAEWTVVILMAVAAPAVALLVNDIRRLVLCSLAIDMPLGLDFAIRNQVGHQGGPSGYIISLMTVALVVGYGVWIVERTPKPRFFAGTTIPALLYLLMTVISLFQAVDLQLGLFGVFLTGQVFLMYFYIANHLRSRQDFHLVATIAAIGLLLQAAFMLAQYFMESSLDIGALRSYSLEPGASAGAVGPRVGGTIGTPNSAAAYLVSALVPTFGAYLSEGLVNRKLALTACLLGTIALVATSTRTAWASLVLALLLLLPQAIRSRAAGRALLIVTASALLLGGLFGRQISSRLETAMVDRTRPELAAMAYNIIGAFPLGVGENNYDRVMSDEYAHPAWVGHGLMVVHNKYLLVRAETGVQGLAAFVLLLLATVWPAKRWLFRTGLCPRFGIFAASLLGAFVGYTLHMTTEAFASRANVQILWFLIAMIAAVNRAGLPEAPGLLRA